MYIYINIYMLVYDKYVMYLSGEKDRYTKAVVDG